MQTSAMRACSYIAECSLSYAKIMQGESSSKAVKRSFTRLDIAEPKLILCKDSYLIYRISAYYININIIMIIGFM